MSTATGLPRRVNSTSAPASAWSTMVGSLERAWAMEYLFDMVGMYIEMYTDATGFKEASVVAQEAVIASAR